MTRAFAILVHLFLLASTTFADDGSWHPKGELARLPLANDGGPIIVPVTIGKREWPFVLDTGMPLTILDHTLLPYLGEDVGTEVIAGSRIPLCKPPGMTVQKCTLKPTAVACGNLWNMQTSGIRIYGVLGADSIKELTVHMDFENEVLLFCDSRNSLDPPGKKVDLRINPKGIPYMDASFGHSMHGMHRLDTGVLLTAILDLDLCQSLLDSGNAKKCTDEIFNFGTMEGARHSELFRIKKIGYSDSRLEEGDFVVARDTDPALGIGFFSRFATTISIGQRVAFFKNPTKLKNRGDHTDLDGMKLEKDQTSERVIIREVFAEGTAAKVGVKPGDLVVGIGSKNVEDWPAAQVSRALRIPRDEELPISVSRNGKIVDILLPR